ncbi:hypothetical protein D5929_11965 [Salmonella enterica subsp. enterica serovar Emek]|nr:hypothetical protein [Salmonella enterica subsp. enterica serovar Emek]
MQTRNLTFKARARTIEHLGKGQIADCPTAISELWKNSYDAYARDVALYTIDGDHPCGALIDNGCGMSVEQLVDNWLIVGTESKTRKKSIEQRGQIWFTYSENPRRERYWSSFCCILISSYVFSY